MLCFGETVDDHKATSEEYGSNSVGKQLPQVGIAVCPANIGPDDVLRFGCPLHIRCIDPFSSFEGVLITITEDVLDLLENGEVIEMEDKITCDIGVEGDEDRGELITVLLLQPFLQLLVCLIKLVHPQVDQFSHSGIELLPVVLWLAEGRTILALLYPISQFLPNVIHFIVDLLELLVLEGVLSEIEGLAHIELDDF